MMDAAIRLANTGVPFLRIAHTVHDELIFVVPDEYVDRVKTIVHADLTEGQRDEAPELNAPEEYDQVPPPAL